VAREESLDAPPNLELVRSTQESLTLEFVAEAVVGLAPHRRVTPFA
jgi:hypothetical protein